MGNIYKYIVVAVVLLAGCSSNPPNRLLYARKQRMGEYGVLRLQRRINCRWRTEWYKASDVMDWLETQTPYHVDMDGKVEVRRGEKYENPVSSTAKR